MRRSKLAGRSRLLPVADERRRPVSRIRRHRHGVTAPDRRIKQYEALRVFEFRLYGFPQQVEVDEEHDLHREFRRGKFFVEAVQRDNLRRRGRRRGDRNRSRLQPADRFRRLRGLGL